MSNKKKEFRIDVAIDECKGCLRCVNACPVNALRQTASVNIMGCVYIEYTGGCIGCGSCYYSCPEPGALTVIEIEHLEDEKNEKL